MRAGALYLGHPDAAYELEPDAQARLLGMIWAEARVMAPKKKASADPVSAFMARGGGG